MDTMIAKTWGAAIGAIAEGEPQVVEMLAAHDARDSQRCCEEGAAGCGRLSYINAWRSMHAQKLAEWLRARAESYGGQKEVKH